MYICVNLRHFAIQQRLAQYCKSTILQFKKKSFSPQEKLVFLFTWNMLPTGFHVTFLPQFPYTSHSQRSLHSHRNSNSPCSQPPLSLYTALVFLFAAVNNFHYIIHFLFIICLLHTKPSWEECLCYIVVDAILPAFSVLQRSYSMAICWKMNEWFMLTIPPRSKLFNRVFSDDENILYMCYAV